MTIDNMKPLQNNFTTPEQSKKLLNLGVPDDSADCYYKEPYATANVLRYCDKFSRYCGDENRNVDYSKYIPCWSATGLVNIFLTCYCDKYTSAKQALSYIDWENQIDWLVEKIIYCAKKEMFDFSKLEE